MYRHQIYKEVDLNKITWSTTAFPPLVALSKKLSLRLACKC